MLANSATVLYVFCLISDNLKSGLFIVLYVGVWLQVCWAFEYRDMSIYVWHLITYCCNLLAQFSSCIRSV